MCVYHINLCLYLKLRCILCVAGTSVNNHKSNIRNNGEYFYMVKNIEFCSYSDYGCIQVKSIIIILIIIEIIILSFQSYMM